MLALFRHHIHCRQSTSDSSRPARVSQERCLVPGRLVPRRRSSIAAELEPALDVTVEEGEAAPAVLSALVALSEPDGVAVPALASASPPQAASQTGIAREEEAPEELPPQAPPPRRGRGRPRKTNFQEVKKPPRRSANSALRSLTTPTSPEPEHRSETSLEVGLRAVKSGTPHGQAIRTALFQQGGEAEEERLKKMAMLNIAQQLSRRLEGAIDDLHQQTLHMDDSEREAHLRALLCEAGGLLNRTRAVVSQFSAEVVPR